MINILRVDIQKFRDNRFRQPLPISSINTSTSDDQITDAEFLYSQILLDSLPMRNSKSVEILQWFQKIYQDDSSRVKIINEFDVNYTPAKVFEWFRRDSPLTRALGRCFEMRNFEIFFRLAFFIRDIAEYIKQNRCSGEFKMFRGQIVSIEQINLLIASNGNYLSISEFFLASLDQNQTTKSLRDFPQMANSHKVLFKIDACADPNGKYPFTRFSLTGTQANGQEILFTIGSVFLVKKVKQENHNIWNVTMELVNKNQPGLDIKLQAIKEKYGVDQETVPSIVLGYLLYQTKNCENAERYFDEIIKQLPDDHPGLSKVLYTAATVSFSAQNYENSLRHYTACISKISETDPLRAGCYYSLGCIYQKQNLKNALDAYETALKLWINLYGNQSTDVANCLNNMGCIQEVMHNYAVALDFHQRALAIRQQCLSNNHPDIAASYNNIGNVYLALNNNDHALKTYLNALEIKKNSANPDSISIASTMENIGLVYERLGQFSEAKKTYQQAESFLQSSQNQHSDQLINIREDIQRMEPTVTCGLTRF